MRRLILCSAVLVMLGLPATADVLNMADGLTSLEMVDIGEPGNPPDTPPDLAGEYGAVAEPYRIGKFEVTTGQYTEFLNAVAAEDTYVLYDTQMWSSEFGCKIQRSGTSGSYSYSVAADRANRPVNYVSWGDAARFANWLHNGQPTGAQEISTTEDGSYRLNGAMTRDALVAVTRKSGATWFLPSEDEWYKAAYYDSDELVYYDLPTGLNLGKRLHEGRPSNDLIDPDPGNNANFHQDYYLHNGFTDYTIGSPYYTTEVGEFENSASPYGTFDQGGNLAEWNESLYSGAPVRVGRGGNWYSTGHGPLMSTKRIPHNPANGGIGLGFRVASIPEPSSITLLVCGVVVGLIWWRRRK